MKTELNIDKTIAPGETVARVQICPFGVFPGEKSDQVCDRAAFEQLVADWKANGEQEILMDFEHQSEVEKIDSDTKAAAWISNLAVDDELGLVGDFKFTERDAASVSARELRFLSPTWYTDADGRPKHMTSVALTNRPNIPVKPILNKLKPEAEAEEKLKSQVEVEERTGKFHSSTSTSNFNSSELPLPASTQPQPQKEKQTMNEIKVLLGLPPEATDEEVLAAIKACVHKNKECECAALEKEADEFAEQNAKKCNKEVLKAQYIANKEIARAIVAGIPDAPAEPQKILNKGAAPKDAEGLELQRNKAIADYRAAHPNCDFSTAWSACRAASPELF